MNPFDPAYQALPWPTPDDPTIGSPPGPLANLLTAIPDWQPTAPVPIPLFSNTDGPPSDGGTTLQLRPALPPSSTFAQSFYQGVHGQSAAAASAAGGPSVGDVIASSDNSSASGWGSSNNQRAGRPQFALLSLAAPPEGVGARPFPYSYDGGPPPAAPGGLDDGIYRPGSSQPATFLPVASSQDDEVAAESGGNPSPQEMYRSYRFEQAARQLRQIEPDNKEGYRQFWGAPNDQDIEEVQTELKAAQARAWIRRYRPDLSNVQLPDTRPSWPGSEAHANEAFGSAFVPQRSFRDQGPARRGLPGSVRPDLFRDGNPPDSIEVKNYNIETQRGRSRLVANVRQQAIERAAHLPSGTRQHLLIDARGQNVSDDDIETLKYSIALSSDKNIRYEDIIVRK